MFLLEILGKSSFPVFRVSRSCLLFLGSWHAFSTLTTRFFVTSPLFILPVSSALLTPVCILLLLDSLDYTEPTQIGLDNLLNHNHNFKFPLTMTSNISTGFLGLGHSHLGEGALLSLPEIQTSRDNIYFLHCCFLNV